MTEKYRQLLFQLLSANKTNQSLQPLYQDLLNQIKKNSTHIAQQVNKQSKDSQLFLSMCTKKSNEYYNDELFLFLYEFIKFTYTIVNPVRQNKSEHFSSQKQNPNYSFIYLVYSVISLILTKYIQVSSSSNDNQQNQYKKLLKNVQLCMKQIYNHQYGGFNKRLISKELLMGKTGDIGKLYKQHFHKNLKTSPALVHLNEIHQQEQISYKNRTSIKTVLLLVVFDNLEILSQKAIIGYLWMIYVYCGGNEQTQKDSVNLYLLEKKNLFSIFKYYISIEEMSLMLITLYELSMLRKKNKFQLLSAINMLHKKAANESMFKLSEVAQSIIHLLEDQYVDAFS